METPNTTRMSAGTRTNSIVLNGVIAAVLTVVAISIIQAVAVLVLNPDPAFQPLTVIGFPQIFGIVGVIGATIAYAIVKRFSRNPVRLFERIALVVLVLSFIPDVNLMILGFIPGATVGAAIALMLMHIAVWFISVQTLTRQDKTQA